MTKYLDVIAQPDKPRKPTGHLPSGQYGRQWFQDVSHGEQPLPQAEQVIQDVPVARRRGTFIDMPVRPRLHPQSQPTAPIRQTVRQRVAVSGMRAMDMVVSQPKPGGPHILATTKPVKLVERRSPPIAHKAVAVPAPDDTAPKDSVLEQAVRPQRRWVDLAQWSLIIPGAVLVGLAVQSLTYGEIAIGIYGLFAFIRRVDSRRTFALALISLVAVAVSMLFNRTHAIASNFAVYAFLLLLIGAVQLGVEQILQARHG